MKWQKLYYLFFFVMFGCQEKKNNDTNPLTRNSFLTPSEKGYALTIKRSWGLEKIHNVEKIDVDDKKQTLLVKGEYKNQLGWLYIMDADPFDKLFGPYSDDEFKLRSVELGIENAFTLNSPDIYFKKNKEK